MTMASSTSLMLVGWDDLKCRPIYQRRSVAPTDNALNPKKKKPKKVKVNSGGGLSRTNDNINIDHNARVRGDITAANPMAMSTSLDGNDDYELVDDGGNKVLDRRGKTRTISLSPQPSTSEAHQWSNHDDDNLDVDSTTNDEDTKNNARESMNNFCAKNFIRGDRRKKRGYGTKKSSSVLSNNNATESTFLAVGVIDGYEKEEFISSNDTGHGKASIGQHSIIQEEIMIPLKEESKSIAQMELEDADILNDSGSYECSVQSVLAPVDDTEGGNNSASLPVGDGEMSESDSVSIQSRSSRSPDSTPGSNSNNVENDEKAGSPSHHSDSDVSAFDVPSYGSPNSNASYGNSNILHSEESTKNGEHSLMLKSESYFSGDDSVNSAGQSTMKHEIPMQSPVSERSLLHEHQTTSRASTDIQHTIDTPCDGTGKHTLKSDGQTSSTLQSYDKNELEFPLEEEKGEGSKSHHPSAEQHSPTSIDQANETPFEFTKGEDSTVATLSISCQRNYNEKREFDEFDFTFDDEEGEESKSQQTKKNHKRRSYGDAKPVWTRNNHGRDTAAGAAKQSVAFRKIEWDETKCRPIFHAPPTQSIETRDSSPGGNSLAASSPGDLKNENDASDSQQLYNDNKKVQKKRVYASLFTKKSGLSRAARDRMEIQSPYAPSTNPIIETLGREDEHLPSEDSPGSNDSDLNGQAKKNKSTLDVDFEMEAIMNDSNTHHPQPTSKSSLESARAFFRYLDSNHNLTILNHQMEGISPKSKANVIRTKRKIVHCEQLQVEYSEYCKTAHAAGVMPISLNDFAMNWNLYFTGKGVVRDGLLDED